RARFRERSQPASVPPRGLLRLCAGGRAPGNRSPLVLEPRFLRSLTKGARPNILGSRLNIRILFVAVGLALVGRSAIAKSELTLWYAQPAEKWVEALPVGNGRLGAMVFGGVTNEHIQFNEDTLWTGQPHEYQHEGASKFLPKIRQLLW